MIVERKIGPAVFPIPRVFCNESRTANHKSLPCWHSHMYFRGTFELFQLKKKNASFTWSQGRIQNEYRSFQLTDVVIYVSRVLSNIEKVLLGSAPLQSFYYIPVNVIYVPSFRDQKKNKTPFYVMRKNKKKG